jgi:hypothetical protein
MPYGTITSTENTFGTVNGALSGTIAGTLSGSVGVPGPGVPTGGTAGQVLAKVDGVDYNTAWVNQAGSVLWGQIGGVLTNQLDLSSALNLKAPLESPVFTGDARAVTAPFGDNDTSIATTAFVQAGLLGGTANARNLEVEVRNQSGSSIPAGSIVYISGATGNLPLVTLAQANNDANSAQTMGFTKTAIANNGTGYVIVRGVLENINTSALTEGVQLYLSPTTPGTWTTTKPSAPQHLVYVGIVIRSHPTLGTILVAVQNGYELNELHDVKIASKANNNLLAYDSATNLWKNKTYSALGLLTSADAASTYYLASNPAGYQTAGQVSTALAPYLLSSTASATYQTQAAMSAYATQAWVDAQGYLQAGALTGYALESWVTSQGYLTDAPSDGSLYARKDNGWQSFTLPTTYITSVTSPLSVDGFGDLTIDLSAYETVANAAATYYPLANPAGYITSADLTTYAPKASPALTGNVTITSNSTGAALFIEQAGTGNILTLHDQASDTNFVAIDQNGKVNTIPSVTASAGFNVPHGTAPTTPVNGDIWTTSGGLFYRINGATISPATLAGGTFTGLVSTPASTTTNAGFRVIPGAAPTTPVSGDVWITTGAAGSINFRNQSSVQAVPTLGLNNTFTNTNTFSGTTLNFGSGTAATTIGLGNGATASASTKRVNIGTAGLSGSTTVVNIGSDVSGSTSTANVNALLISRASTATQSGLRVLPGVAPTSPVNGDIWTDTAGVYARINGATQSLVAPAIATVAQTNNPSSNTTAMSPDKARQMMMFQGFQQFLGGGSVGTSGTGAVAPSTSARWRQFQGPNVSTAGYSAFVFDLLNSGIGFVGSKRGANEYGKNYARAFWMSGRTLLGTDDGGFGGDVNNLYRCELGGRNSMATSGDPTHASLGWRVAGGSQAIVFYMRSRQTINGGTYSETTTSFTPVYNQWFDWMVTYNGTDTCQMFVNDTLVGTISANFTGFQGEHYNFYSERIEQTATSATRLEVNTLPPRIYFSE